MDEKRIDAGTPVVKLLTDVGACMSRSEARMLVAKGAIAINGVREANPARPVDTTDGETITLRIGNRPPQTIRVGKTDG